MYVCDKSLPNIISVLYAQNLTFDHVDTEYILFGVVQLSAAFGTKMEKVSKYNLNENCIEIQDNGKKNVYLRGYSPEFVIYISNHISKNL